MNESDWRVFPGIPVLVQYHAGATWKSWGGWGGFGDSGGKNGMKDDYETGVVTMHWILWMVNVSLP